MQWMNVCRWYDQLQHSAPIYRSAVAPAVITFASAPETKENKGAAAKNEVKVATKNSKKDKKEEEEEEGTQS